MLMQFIVTIDSEESGVGIAECPAIPGGVREGATKPEAIKNVCEAASFARKSGLSVV